MTKIINLKAYTNAGYAPTLVLVDLQQEYLAAPRALALSNAPNALTKCAEALAFARSMGFPVVFMRWIAQKPYFNSATPFVRWIKGFEPNPTADMVFEREKPSCYSSKFFADVIEEGGGNFVLAGFAAEAACLSTAVEAFHRGHKCTFLADASASHAFHNDSAEEVHRVIQGVIGLYGEVQTTQSWIAQRRPAVVQI